MDILCATDKNFIPYCGIMLTSLFFTNRAVKFHVHIIIPNDISEEELNCFKDLAAEYHQQISFVTINPLLYKYCPVREGDNVSLAAYYRILAPEILPKAIDKILYLDCDILINGSIEKLYNMDISNHSCAVVMDPIACRSDEYERLQYSPDLSYFNSGVMLINLDYWRRNDITKQCLDFIRSYPERVVWHDQDALNYVLRDSKIMLDVTYNFQSQFLYKKYIWGELSDVMKSRIKSVVNEGPVVIHFSNSDKPWKNGSLHPYVKFYEYYKRISRWHAHRNLKQEYSKKRTIKSMVFDLLVFLKLKQCPTRYQFYPLKK